MNAILSRLLFWTVMAYLALCVYASTCAAQSLEVDTRGPDAFYIPPEVARRHPHLTHAEKLFQWDAYFYRRLQLSCVVLCNVGLEDDMRRPIRITIRVKEPK